MNSDTLKQEIRKHALSFARRRNLPVDDTHASALIFSNLDDSFYPESLENIRRTSDWNSRTRKAHQNVTGALEMQSSNSSDTLLMSIFCHPSIAKWAGVRKVLGNDMVTIAFGVPGVVRIDNGQTDTTEIDMALPGVFCEAKLTEADFTHKRLWRHAVNLCADGSRRNTESGNNRLHHIPHPRRVLNPVRRDVGFDMCQVVCYRVWEYVLNGGQQWQQI